MNSRKSEKLLVNVILAMALIVFFHATTPAQTTNTTTSDGSPRPTADSITAGSATATIGQREITASAAEVSVQTEGDNARVQLDKHVVTVERERVLVDGGERAKLPVSARSVRLTLSNGQLTVVADGRAVLTQKLSEQ